MRRAGSLEFKRRPIWRLEHSMLVWVTTLAVSVAAATYQLQATRPVPTFGAVSGGASVVLSNADGRNPYTGIVRYQGRATCSGVFLQAMELASQQ